MSANNRGANNKVDVGAQLKKLREERQISMRTLAKASNLSANALSMIERGLTSPSVSTLTKLACALEVPITAFFRREPERQKVVFRPAEARQRLALKHGFSEDLGGDTFTERIETFILTLDAGADSGPYALCHTGSELVYLEKGLIDFVVDSQRYHLQPGDSLLFAAGINHSWNNPGPEPAILMVVISAYGEDERPQEYHLVGELVEDDEVSIAA
jgi:transcriptional regulator with XRE-family HTH domain